MAKRTKSAVSAVSDGVILCQDGKYRWTYEADMLRCPIIFHDVAWVLAVSVGITWLFTTTVGLLAGSMSWAWLFQSVALFFGIFLVLTFYRNGGHSFTYL